MTRGSRLLVIEALVVLLVGLLVPTAHGGQSASTPTALPQTTESRISAGATPILDVDRPRPSSRYQLRSGDVLELNFPFVPDFNQTVTVSPDGFVTLRALGTLRVQSLTVPELSERLRAEYDAILQNPVLTVDLKEFEEPYFVVAGEVERPGRYELRSGTTATQALAVAGGLKDRAKRSEAVILRQLPEGGFESTPLDLKTMLKEGRPNSDVPLRPGDMLFVPRGRGPINWTAVSAVVSSLWVVSYLAQ
jgi:polysaccharide export outer membrane protein